MNYLISGKNPLLRPVAFYLLLLSLSLSISSIAQTNKFTKVLGYPEKFSPPKDLLESEMLGYLGEKSVYSSKVPWMVISDRADNQTFDKPDGKPYKKLDFKEAFYVVSETSGWVEMVSGTNDGLKLVKQEKYVGWIRKDKVLLWNECLVDPNTEIHKKVLLLNKASSILDVMGDKENTLVSIYNSSSATIPVEKVRIYTYFFLLKRENNRYLLAQEYRLSPSNVETRLLGWVSSARCEIWNTRIALEPNYDEAAYNERCLNQDKYKLIGYNNAGSAALQMQKGIITESNVFWANDPCVADKVLLSTSNPRRFIGDIIRFPLLPPQPDQAAGVHYSGVIGDIMIDIEGNAKPITVKQRDKIDVDQTVEQKIANLSKVNVLYVIEATPELAQYKDILGRLYTLTVLECEDKVPEANVSVGMVLYRDISERKEGRDIEIMPLARNENQFNQFAGEATFINTTDQDPVTNLRDGIYKGVMEAGFKKDQSNIIIVIGSEPDFSVNKIRREAAIAAKDKGYHEQNQVVDALSSVDASIYYIQCKNSGDVYGEKFKEQASSILLERSKDSYNSINVSLSEEMGLKQTPALPQTLTSGINRLVGSPEPGFLYIPSAGQSLSSIDLEKYMTEAIQDASGFIKGFIEEIKQTFDQGKPFASAGPYAPAMVKWLDKEIKRQSSMSSTTLKNLALGTKYELYKEVYFPSKVNTARSPLVSYVLFMPEDDLVRYIEKLKAVQEAGLAGTDNERREKLFNVFKDLIFAFTGNYSMSQSEIEQMSLNDFQSIMNGIKKEGWTPPKRVNFLLGNILDEKEMSATEVNEIIEGIEQKLSKLEKIRKMGRNYEFSFNSEDDVYYWITMEESF